MCSTLLASQSEQLVIVWVLCIMCHRTAERNNRNLAQLLQRILSPFLLAPQGQQEQQETM